MSLSPDDIGSNLYCSESANEVVSSDGAGVCSCIVRLASEVPSDDESFIVLMFESELDQMPGQGLLRGLLKCDEIVEARLDAINWMLKVHAYYNFRNETAYLSIKYLDRYLCSNALPRKRWPWQLLAVACLSLAAKMEETRVPLLLDLQVLEPKFLFKPKTVQQMELLVMAKLRWRLHITTPLDFVDYFISKLQCLNGQIHHFPCLFTLVWDLILCSCRANEFLDFTPSTIAAAAVICAARQKVNDHRTIVFHERVSQELLNKCCLLFEEHLMKNMLQPP